MLLRVENLQKNFGNLKVLRGIDLQIAEGEMVYMLGASGAGKSTLLHLIGALDKVDEGSVWFEEKNIESFSEREVARYRNQKIGFVFQFHYLMPEFDAVENAAMPAWINGISKSQAMTKAEELLAYLGLGERLHHKPGELSGGEQQRVAVARALINSPKLILADEPSGNLDSRNAEELHKLFLQLCRERKQAFLIATHNERLAEGSDRRVTIKDGVIT